MKRWIVRAGMIAGLGVLLELPGGSSRGQDPDARGTLQMLYDGQAQMLKNKDVDGLMNLTTTNYVGIRPDGKQMTRAQEMREFRSQLNALREIRMVKYTLSKPALHGFAATVTATRRLVAVGNGPHHRRVGVDSTSTMRDVWVQTPAGWKLKRHQVLSIVGAVGGKRVVWTAPRVR